MGSVNRLGRPRASSRDTLAEAACELFFEQGYDATSVSDITARAGVSRSSFFNYFGSKHDVLWFGVDERIEELEIALGPGSPAAAVTLEQALDAFAAELQPDALALALANAEAMGAVSDLERETARRSNRLAAAIATRLRQDGASVLVAQVLGLAYGGAIMVALQRWALEGPGRTRLSDRMREALAIVRSMPGA